MDMDLDELDQAVNKMMEPKGRRSVVKRELTPTPAVATLPVVTKPQNDNNVVVKTTSPPPPAPRVAPVLVKPVVSPTPVPTVHAHESHLSSAPVSRPVPKVPERRRMHPGAMDIIPSSPKTAPPSSRPARVAADIAPVSPATKPAPVMVGTQKPAESAPVTLPAEVSDEVLASIGMSDDQKPEVHIPSTPAPIPAPAPAPEPAKSKAADSWPDPLDFHGFTDELKEAKKPETPPTMSPEKSEENNSTPFVPAKVEKRPLGAYSQVEAPVEPPVEPTPVEAPPRPELAEASIKSNQHVTDEPEHDMDELRQMAIPQQYQTAVHDKKDTVHNMYDTKEYHAPPQMMPAARHKSSGSPWVTVSIVVLVVLIIAALAFGYFMVTGTFDITKLW